jgi:hypothetical protein
MNLLVVGSRSFKNEKLVYKVLDMYKERYDKSLFIFSGGCSGPDTYAKTWAEENVKEIGGPPIITPPEYDKYDKYLAPKKRNIKMVLAKPDEVLAFYDHISGGTAQCTLCALLYNIPASIVNPKGKIKRIFPEEGYIDSVEI